MDESMVPAEVFDEIVRDAVDALPDWVVPVLDEMAVTVADLTEEPPAAGQTLLGLYRGIPRTRSGGRPAGALPDVITLYRLPILATCTDTAEVPGRVLKVLGHEVGHSLGLSDARLRELGWF